jgi:NIMA (never in mitosis gene a)-related kinase
MLMQRLTHPAIVAYKASFFDSKEHLCIVMTFCDGGDLQQRINAAKNTLFKEDQIMNWFVQVMCGIACPLRGSWLLLLPACGVDSFVARACHQIALGIHYMHSRKVLHRDIKAQNIFLLGNGRMVLGDLGISKVRSPRSCVSAVPAHAALRRRCR